MLNRGNYGTHRPETNSYDYTAKHNMREKSRKDVEKKDTVGSPGKWKEFEMVVRRATE